MSDTGYGSRIAALHLVHCGVLHAVWRRGNQLEALGRDPRAAPEIELAHLGVDRGTGLDPSSPALTQNSGHETR
jgi:hypothetical protein